MIWGGFEPGPKNVSRLTLKNIARLEPGSIIFYHYASKTHMKLLVRKQLYEKTNQKVLKSISTTYKMFCIEQVL